MYKNTIAAISLGIIYSISSTAIYAQENNLEAIPPNNSVNAQALRETNTFGWSWLLPLVAIPLILYLVWPKDVTDEYTQYRYDDLAGLKGGRTRKSIDEKDDSDIHSDISNQ